MRTFTIDASALADGDISLGELIEICEYADVGPDDLAPLLGDPHAGVRKLKAYAALAWIIARRDEPTLTLAEVLAGRIEAGEDADDDPDPISRDGGVTRVALERVPS